LTITAVGTWSDSRGQNRGSHTSDRRAGNLPKARTTVHHHLLPLQATAVWVWGDAFRQIRPFAFVPALVKPAPLRLAVDLLTG